MIDPAGKKAARRSMGEAVAERDIDRLLKTARTPGGAVAAARPTQKDFAMRLDLQRTGRSAVRAEAGVADPDFDYDDELPPHPYAQRQAPPLTIWDFPVFVLYACLGVFTRIWTDVTLYFDFGESNGFRMFAIGVSVALHVFIFAMIGNAWRARWEMRNRNLFALSVLVGYLGFRTLTHL
ncbi:MAG: hypothetical protein R3D59_17455 [Paracoccaceae bacterium]